MNAQIPWSVTGPMGAQRRATVDLHPNLTAWIDMVRDLIVAMDASLGGRPLNDEEAAAMTSLRGAVERAIEFGEADYR